MNSKIRNLSIAPVAVWLLTACNYTDGPCWRRGEGSEGAGAGTGDGSVILSSGSGDLGDTSPGQSQGNGDPPLKCNKMMKTTRIATAIARRAHRRTHHRASALESA